MTIYRQTERLNAGDALFVRMCWDQLTYDRAREAIDVLLTLAAEIEPYMLRLEREERTEREFAALTVRTRNGLLREGYRTADQVRATRDSRLREIRNFGRVSLSEVRDVLGPYAGDQP